MMTLIITTNKLLTIKLLPIILTIGMGSYNTLLAWPVKTSSHEVPMLHECKIETCASSHAIVNISCAPYQRSGAVGTRSLLAHIDPPTSSTRRFIEQRGWWTTNSTWPRIESKSPVLVRCTWSRWAALGCPALCLAPRCATSCAVLRDSHAQQHNCIYYNAIYLDLRLKCSILWYVILKYMISLHILCICNNSCIILRYIVILCYIILH